MAFLNRQVAVVLSIVASWALFSPKNYVRQMLPGSNVVHSKPSSTGSVQWGQAGLTGNLSAGESMDDDNLSFDDDNIATMHALNNADVYSSSSSQSSPNINNHTSLKHFNKTFIVGAGRGTSGTHGMFQATCRLGYPSIHWSVHCLNLTTPSPLQPTASSSSSKAHVRLMALVKMAEFCVVNQTRTRCGSAVQWKRRIVEALDEIIIGVNHNNNSNHNGGNDGIVQALHDSPYPSLLSYLLPLLRRHYAYVVLMISERDPEQYVDRRNSMHYGRDDLICRSNTNNNTASLVFNPVSLKGGMLDWLDCIDQAILLNRKKKRDDADTDLDLKDVFVSLAEQVQDNRQLLVDQVRQWQDAVRAQSDYHVNFFERPEPTKPGLLAKEMPVPSILPRGQQPLEQSEFLAPPDLYAYYARVAESWRSDSPIVDPPLVLDDP